jgi:hypothetical protein
MRRTGAIRIAGRNAEPWLEMNRLFHNLIKTHLLDWWDVVDRCRKPSFSFVTSASIWASNDSR